MKRKKNSCDSDAINSQRTVLVMSSRYCTVSAQPSINKPSNGTYDIFFSAYCKSWNAYVTQARVAAHTQRDVYPRMSQRHDDDGGVSPALDPFGNTRADSSFPFDTFPANPSRQDFRVFPEADVRVDNKNPPLFVRRVGGTRLS